MAQVRQTLSSLIGYFLTISSTLAQGTPVATGADIPWIWIILAVVVIGGGIWWYMNRMRGPKL